MGMINELNLNFSPQLSFDWSRRHKHLLWDMYVHVLDICV